MKNELIEKQGSETQTTAMHGEPSLYFVMVHNDDFTPMEFVVGMLEKYFYMNRVKAIATMLEAHAKGKAACGTFPKDIAESKLAEVGKYAKVHEHPLTCSMEVV